MARLIERVVWAAEAAGYLEAGAEGTQQTTVEKCRDCTYMKGLPRKELEEICTEAELLIFESDCTRLGALKWLALLDDGGITAGAGGDVFDGPAEGERDCEFMDAMSMEELERLKVRAEATIREAENQRLSAIKRLAALR